MSDLRELYQEVILDHSKRPRNFGTLEGASHRARGDNPICGDKLTLYLTVKDGTVEEVCFEGKGCAISTASASMLTQLVKGKRTDEALDLFERFHTVLTTPPDEDVDLGSLGKLAALAGVREFPVRVKCASLAWHTLNAALEGRDNSVTTE